MSTNPQTIAPAAGTPAAEAEAAKAKDVLNDMDSRRILANPTDALAYLGKCMADFSDFNNYPVAAPGVSVETDEATDESSLVFDPEIYGDGINVMVSVLTQRGEGEGARSSVKAIVIAPVPSFSAILANPEGSAWAQRILEKEMNHVAVRQLRKAESIDEVIDSMPKTLADYISSERGGGLLQAYEDLWRPIKNNMGKLSRGWKLANLSKKELRRALESSAYATEYYPTLEESKQGSLFVFALNGLIQTAKKQGLDPTIFERWLANRDEKQIDIKAEDDEEETFTLDDLTTAMTATPAATPLPRNEGETDEAYAARVEAAKVAPPATETPAATPEQPAAEAPATEQPTAETPAAPVADETAEMTEAELEAATNPDATAETPATANETPAA